MAPNTALLIACHNRKEKTIHCLTSLYECTIPEIFMFDVILVDDGSTDGTAQAVKEQFPQVDILYGDGNLYWAGGMRLAWREALARGYQNFIMLNDDVVLFKEVFKDLETTHNWSLEHFGMGGLYVSSTIDNHSNVVSYGGTIVRKNMTGNKYHVVQPSKTPVSCQITNANILYVHSDVVERIGIFDTTYTHSLADYDYSLTAWEHQLPVLVCPGVGGYCKNDHIYNWSPVHSTLRQRIAHLHSPKGLAYKEYIYYLRKHFPWSLPYLFVMVWMKAFFPIFWEKFKK